MSDIIQLLPDSVANQIAAGEVIQRPASAVKELLENAVDAGSTSIKLIIKDAGRTLIQVIDNGCGMSETDARMSIERHATSKIKKVEDLFSIRTKGFRGEALASIAAVAQVELKTRRIGDELGTTILIEGSDVKSQEQCSCAEGTSFSVKNLFFNVPARRVFLKSNAVETRHIIDEFQRVALTHPEVAFTLHHNGLEIFHLNTSGLRQRIVAVFGNNYNENLVPVQEETTILNISGFVGKPQFSKKTKGEQFFFVNQRFIKNTYLNHAVQSAYQELLPQGSYPSYFLYIDIAPNKIDVNIHPTKTEIKFEDEKAVYAIVRSAVKRALGQYSITPALDFEQENNLPVSHFPKDKSPVMPTVHVDRDYNPFKTGTAKFNPEYSGQNSKFGMHEKGHEKEWLKLHDDLEKDSAQLALKRDEENVSPSKFIGNEQEDEKAIFQLHNEYIVAQIKSGIMIIDQQLAHERILYEKYLHSLVKNQGHTQQNLFPQAIEFSAQDFQLVKELENEIRAMGFDIREFGKNTLVIHGTPPDIESGNEKQILEALIEQYQNNAELKLDKRENLARSIAKNLSVKRGKKLSKKEMEALIDELFACKIPAASPTAKPVFVMMTLEELNKKFSR